MHTLFAAFLLLALAIAPVYADKPEAVKAIDLSGLKIDPDKAGEFSKPAVITSRDELAKAILDEAGAALEKIARQVDFKTQKLLFFRWTGSGTDKLSYEFQAGEKPQVTFILTPGFTDDVRHHVQMFAIPKDAVWKTEMK